MTNLNEKGWERYNHKSVVIFLDNGFKYKGYVNNTTKEIVNILDEHTQSDRGIPTSKITSIEVIK